MRKPPFMLSSAALLLASSPALAGPCPATRAEGVALLMTLPRLGDDICFYPCQRAYKYDANKTTMFGVQPMSISSHSWGKQLMSVEYLLPGSIGNYLSRYRKAFPNPYCDSDGRYCSFSVKGGAEGMLQQVELIPDKTGNNTRLNCNFYFAD
ncbi:hypothetical protein FHS95_001190 [Sphingomonas naasensis]|uniref:Uncharacterized protein n=1 Tax=Sphingomonas naasensis TaxID=1344951 RepID=A0A4S1WEU1_9SPHN|nr:hypothetical protein [Sphingomonas naasensis]NIJ19521.1 hypothetical protein [Sphingomonas naasensis]TGX39256.1 hypothetical protein E5A74_17215 [Sphingomonas naasensis]